MYVINWKCLSFTSYLQKKQDDDKNSTRSISIKKVNISAVVLSGGTSPAQWEDITGTTPLTFIKDCVSFTTNVSARYGNKGCQKALGIVFYYLLESKKMLCLIPVWLFFKMLMVKLGLTPKILNSLGCHLIQSSQEAVRW